MIREVRFLERLFADLHDGLEQNTKSALRQRSRAYRHARTHVDVQQ